MGVPWLAVAFIHSFRLRLRGAYVSGNLKVTCLGYVSI